MFTDGDADENDNDHDDNHYKGLLLSCELESVKIIKPNVKNYSRDINSNDQSNTKNWK